ncbi:hypothetical protein BS47DRAFT_1335134 [Hydnum rufescens UP504]|uniref:Uncharacterized protein n=1 Tax=Hydnum rufescens UP504 TaxID=1448309 RepID=A0A9P6BBA3_9AGAM|nr:hypothetical protein BS47DRAFT_1335134 [Hydnum rufescens UP504]
MALLTTTASRAGSLRDLIPQHVQNCLDGKASKWYVMYVVRHPEKWNLETIMKGLFNWCFPPEF